MTRELPLFGGDRAWSPNDWTSADDRVRGGSSYSNLTCSPDSPVASFHGNLDITALGGAGFASHCTTSESGPWDLSGHEGLEIHIGQADGKKYTITLTNELLPKRPDGRERSTLKWESDFCPGGPGKIFIKWGDFRLTYRGKPADDAGPLDLKEIRRFGILIRRGTSLLTLSQLQRLRQKPTHMISHM